MMMIWLQDSRLNYVEQHAERMGLDSSRLENLRVSASRSTPMGDTLDLCARYTDASGAPSRTASAILPRLLTAVLFLPCFSLESLNCSLLLYGL